MSHGACVVSSIYFRSCRSVVATHGYAKLLRMRITKAMRDAVLQANGRKGGHARAENMTQEQRKDQARRAALARWAYERERADEVSK